MADEARPILARGELLRRDAVRVSGGGKKYFPQSFEQARGLLLPQVRAMRQSMAELPQECRGTRVVVEATLLPNFLANSYFPSQLFTHVDLVPVGSRSATGALETAKKII